MANSCFYIFPKYKKLFNSVVFSYNVVRYRPFVLISLTRPKRFLTVCVCVCVLAQAGPS